MFQDPTQVMQQMLTNVRPIMMGTYRHETDCNYLTSFIIYMMRLIYSLSNISITPVQIERIIYVQIGTFA